jgi:hypothetical protein
MDRLSKNDAQPLKAQVRSDDAGGFEARRQSRVCSGYDANALEKNYEQNKKYFT